jgi:uncharacterized membrane protein YeiH
MIFGTDEALHVFHIIGLIVEAMTAALTAGRRQMDWVGVCLLGCVTALGGGTVRDLLLNRHPLPWVVEPYYILMTGGAALATIAIVRYMHHLQRVFFFLDAVGLVVFTVIGCNVAISLGMPTTVVIASGMISGCAGGVLRDILCDDVPLLFRAELYGTVSVVTGASYLIGRWVGWNHDLVMAGAMALGLALRLLALRFGWRMPKFIYEHDFH